MKFELFGHLFILKHHKLIKNVLGIRSICEDKQHILMIDLDAYSLSKLKERLSLTQSKFNLGDMHIFKTKGTDAKGNFHVVCFDKMSMGQVVDINTHFDNEATLMHQVFSIKRGAFVLRFSDKGKGVPKYVETIKGIPNQRKQSSAHLAFFNMYYKLKIGIDNPDGYKKVSTVEYPTVFKKESPKIMDVFPEALQGGQ